MAKVPHGPRAPRRPAPIQAQLSSQFLEGMAEDFAANGQDAIAKAREKDPIGYLRAVAALLPKDIAPDKPLDGLSDDELAQIIEAIRGLRVALDRQADAGRRGRRAAAAGAEPRRGAQRSGAARSGAQRPGNGAGAADQP